MSIRLRMLHFVATLLITKFIRCDASTRTTTTSFGVLRGETVSPDADDLPPVTQYLGVPYGVAPSGQYRFNMAISAAKWTHMPKDAHRLSSVCIQFGPSDLSEAKALRQTSAQRYYYFHKLYPKLRPQSEDCLYMNLFVPERIEHSRSQLPVLVIVHGDEYGWNSGNPYNGTVIASYGQIIVITLNYRLGVFGFLGRCESSSCTGNSGLSDLVAALKMLSNILPAFGGDSNMITLLGWGSGASLISLLMASPITQPANRLFRRTILLDGSALSPWAITANPQPHFFQLAEYLECINPMDDKRRTLRGEKSIESIVRCLQEHSTQNITRAARKITEPSFLSKFAPIIDGQVVPNKPTTSFGQQYGSLFRDIDLMVGFSNNPAHYLLPNEDLKKGIDRERREKIFRTLVRNLYDFHRKEILAAITNEYTDWDNPKDHPKTIRNGVLSALNDVLFVAPLVETARLHSIDDTQANSNTYMFLFAHVSKQAGEEMTESGIHGSITGDYLPYIFGYPLKKDDDLFSGFNAEDKSIARVMMHYISNFVKTGTPSKPVQLAVETPITERFHSTAWPQCNQQNREPYLEISDRPRVKNYYRNAQVSFWNILVPQLESAGKEDDNIRPEHNLLSNPYERESFFGIVRPYANYANEPFPPPPLPPTPLPKNIKKITTADPSQLLSQITTSTGMPFVKAAQNSTMLSVTVAVGCGLLFLNICIGLGLYRQCNKREETKKKLQLQYQTYNANHQGGCDMNYLNNTNGPQHYHMLSYPALSALSHRSSIANSSINNDYDQSRSSYQNYNSNNDDTIATTSSILEQEPLLSTNNKVSMGSLRSGVSPTCPRHGRAAMAAQPAGRISSINAPPIGHTLEEIQV